MSNLIFIFSGNHSDFCGSSRLGVRGRRIQGDEEPLIISQTINLVFWCNPT